MIILALTLASGTVFAKPLQKGDHCTTGNTGTCKDCPGGASCHMYTSATASHYECGPGQGSGGFCDGSFMTRNLSSSPVQSAVKQK